MLAVFAYGLQTQFFFGFLWLICLQAQWVLFLLIFVKVGFWGFLPHFACHPVFLGFLGTVLVVDPNIHWDFYPTIYAFSICIGIHVTSVLLILFSVECCLYLFSCCSHPTLVIYVLHGVGAPIHEHGILRDPNSQLRSVELCSLGLGWEYALPTGTHRVISMGM